jgi:hypothetical protein
VLPVPEPVELVSPVELPPVEVLPVELPMPDDPEPEVPIPLDPEVPVPLVLPVPEEVSLPDVPSEPEVPVPLVLPVPEEVSLPDVPTEPEVPAVPEVSDEPVPVDDVSLLPLVDPVPVALEPDRLGVVRPLRPCARELWPDVPLAPVPAVDAPVSDPVVP